MNVVLFDNLNIEKLLQIFRYNLMANRVLLLLTLASRSDSQLSSKILGETAGQYIYIVDYYMVDLLMFTFSRFLSHRRAFPKAGHFLRNLKSQLPQSRLLAISALNTLIEGEQHKSSGHPKQYENSSIGGVLNQILQEEGFFNETLNSLSNVHIIDTETLASKGNHGSSSFQSATDKAITLFYFDFSASWPRTPSWISLLGGDTFYSNFARIFKRLIQECGIPVLYSLGTALEEFSSAKERSKQCVAAEALAGLLHSDINGLLEEWDKWIMPQIEKIILAPSVESIPEWAACIRYTVTGKGKYGTRIPILRQKILDCLARPLPQSLATSILAKRYSFLSIALIEISPHRMIREEAEYHLKLLDELLGNMSNLSAQV